MQVSERGRDDFILQFIEPKVLDALNRFLASDEYSQLAGFSGIIADSFGTQEKFNLLTAEGSERDKLEKKLGSSFLSNLELLVQKTWIEESDEGLKEQVLYRISGLCGYFQSKAYREAYTEFIDIFRDVVYLLFGSLTKKDDFPEYAFRIDPGFGTFWWYVTSLPSGTGWSEEKCRAAVLLGMFFLANY